MPTPQTFALREVAGIPCLQPDWPVPAHIHSLFTLRSGGVSQPPYNSLNLGDHVGDDPAAVQTNRQRLGEAVRALSAQGGGSSSEASQPVFLNQVHGVDVARWQPDAPLQNGACADAVLATQPGQVCVIMVADCLPVLFAVPQAGVVAAAHAGWRGLAGEGGRGVLETTFAQLVDAVQAKTAQTGQPWGAEEIARQTLVWLGPCIGPAAFEVSDDVPKAFAAVQPDAQNAQHSPSITPMPPHCFAPQAGKPGKWLADLAALARWRLGLMGIGQIWGNDSTAPWCTVINEAYYFSHRRDAQRLGASGRMAACVWVG